MDISGVSSLAVSTLVNTATPNEAASIAALEKALEIQQQMAAQLIASLKQSIPEPDSTGSLGSVIDVYA